MGTPPPFIERYRAGHRPLRWMRDPLLRLDPQAADVDVELQHDVVLSAGLSYSPSLSFSRHR
jgi:hypothetical protein